MVLRWHISTMAQMSYRKAKRCKSANDSDLVFRNVLHTYVHDLLEEVLKFSARLFVDVARDALDTAAAREAANVWLGDAVNVIPQDFSVERSIYDYGC
jgi:hypothetical protein